MKCFIITGTSRGLGEAIAARLLGPDHLVFCIARNENRGLAHLAREKGAHLKPIRFNLADTSKIDALMGRIIQECKQSKIDGYYLINNAGMLAPIKPAEKCTAVEITENFTVNTIAPMALTTSFIRWTQNFSGDKRILNISSGAARNPYYGWSSYCSAKAALDMFTRCVAVEQAGQPVPVTIVSFVPGIIDTAMQAEIRGTTKENFMQLERFIEFKERGKLKSPDFVAKKVVKVLFDKEIESGSLIDIKDLL